MRFTEFIYKALSDKGEPSSKRLAAFMVLVFTLIMEAAKLFGTFDGFDYDTMITFLGFVVVSLGITGLEKFKKGAE